MRCCCHQSSAPCLTVLEVHLETNIKKARNLSHKVYIKIKLKVLNHCLLKLSIAETQLMVHIYICIYVIHSMWNLVRPYHWHFYWGLGWRAEQMHPGPYWERCWKYKSSFLLAARAPAVLWNFHSVKQKDRLTTLGWKHEQSSFIQQTFTFISKMDKRLNTSKCICSSKCHLYLKSPVCKIY